MKKHYPHSTNRDTPQVLEAHLNTHIDTDTERYTDRQRDTQGDKPQVLESTL